MEQYVIDQIKLSLTELPKNLLKGAFSPKSTIETKDFRARSFGFIKGVCHPNENYSQINEANIGWIRIDIPFPYDNDGNVRDCYLGFKERCRGYRENGIKVMAVTPYPSSYIEAGIDPRENDEKVREIAVFMLNDLRDFINAIQITNEMGIPHFTLPLNLDEAARFIGCQAEAMFPVRGKILIGYNSAGPQPDLHLRMKPYYKFCDYIGIDIYIGCFANVPGLYWFFDAMLYYLWGMTKKPILLQEFGYISGGKPKSKAEKNDVLRRYGVSSEKEAYENIEAFVSHLPAKMQEHIRHVSPNVSHQGDLIFKSDFVNHFYCELPGITKIPGCPHTPEGQANFYRHILPRLRSLPFLCGAFIYCYSDSEACYICSQNDCPTETRWGLVDCKGEPKPSYYQVKNNFAK